MPAPLPIGSDKIRNRLFAVGVAGFLTVLTIGVDGHPIFQILAIESLGLGPRAIGIALGLGTLSVPIQIWAARIPLHRARHNLRLFMWSAGVMALLTAALVMFAEPGSWVAGLALVVAIMAEVSVSVLMATAWQPVISYSLTPAQRAFVMGPTAATRGLVIAASTVLFGALGRTGRGLFLVVLAVVVVTIAETLRSLPAPPESESESESGPESEPLPESESEPKLESQSGRVDPKETTAAKHQAPVAATDRPADVMSLYMMMAGQALARWPLFITYAAVKLWPAGSLGLLGAALVAGHIATSLLWRDPGRHVLTIIRVGVAIATICSVVLVTIVGPISSSAGAGVLFLLAVVISAANSIMGTASMELVHRRVTTTTSVQVMTMLDVIASTTVQLNMFVAGFLIASSTSGSILLGMDVYQLWILATVLLPVAAAARLRLLPGDVESEPINHDQSDSGTPLA